MVFYICCVYTSCSSVPWELNYTRSWTETNCNLDLVLKEYQRYILYTILSTANPCSWSWTEKSGNPVLVFSSLPDIYYIPSFLQLILVPGAGRRRVVILSLYFKYTRYIYYIQSFLQLILVPGGGRRRIVILSLYFKYTRYIYYIHFLPTANLVSEAGRRRIVILSL